MMVEAQKGSDIAKQHSILKKGSTSRKKDDVIVVNGSQGKLCKKCATFKSSASFQEISTTACLIQNEIVVCRECRENATSRQGSFISRALSKESSKQVPNSLERKWTSKLLSGGIPSQDNSPSNSYTLQANNLNSNQSSNDQQSSKLNSNQSNNERSSIKLNSNQSINEKSSNKLNSNQSINEKSSQLNSSASSRKNDLMRRMMHLCSQQSTEDPQDPLFFTAQSVMSKDTNRSQKSDYNEQRTHCYTPDADIEKTGYSNSQISGDLQQLSTKLNLPTDLSQELQSTREPSNTESLLTKSTTNEDANIDNNFHVNEIFANESQQNATGGLEQKFEDSREQDTVGGRVGEAIQSEAGIAGTDKPEAEKLESEKEGVENQDQEVALGKSGGLVNQQEDAGNTLKDKLQERLQQHQEELFMQQQASIQEVQVDAFAASNQRLQNYLAPHTAKEQQENYQEAQKITQQQGTQNEAQQELPGSSGFNQVKQEVAA